MQLNQSLNLRQELRLQQILAPRMIQMLKTFHLSYAELVDQVTQTAEDNVFLEVSRFDQLSGRSAKRLQESDGKDVSDFAVSQKESLTDHLIQQLDLEYLKPKEHEIAAYLIDHIDNRGYITNYATVRDDIVKKFKVAPRKVGDILKIIQTFEPEGVGARTIKECLLIQIREHQFESQRLESLFEQIVKTYLDDLAALNYEKIATALDIDTDGIRHIHDFIKNNLTPNPGSRFSESEYNQAVIPSFEARWEDNKLVLTNLEASKGVDIQISDRYLKIIEDPQTDPETKAFLEEKLSRAREFVENIKKRRENLERLIRLILDRQTEFVKKGSAYLVPLHQKELADQLGLSSSTVSRIVSSKFILTPWGTVSFKTLCPRSHLGKTASQLQQIITDIAQEFPSLSDQKLSQILASRGFKIARRTVAKYRLMAGISARHDKPGKFQSKRDPID